jgi:hypothetical protein
LKFKALLNMKSKFLQQLWLVTRIWLVAASVNALLGAIFTSGSLEWEAMWGTFVLTGIFGGLFSIPVLVGLLIIIAIGAALRIHGWLLLVLLYAIGITLTVMVFSAFMEAFPDPSNTTSFDLALLSGIAGITSFYKSILKCGYNNA